MENETAAGMPAEPWETMPPAPFELPLKRRRGRPTKAEAALYEAADRRRFEGSLGDPSPHSQEARLVAQIDGRRESGREYDPSQIHAEVIRNPRRPFTPLENTATILASLGLMVGVREDGRYVPSRDIERAYCEALESLSHIHRQALDAVGSAERKAISFALNAQRIALGETVARGRGRPRKAAGK